MNTKTRDIATTAAFVAILIVSQVALSAINGIELITVLLASFVFCYGFRLGFAAVNSFILIRCAIYGFYPSIMLLYLTYYNLFVLVMGFIGNKSRHWLSRKAFAVSLIGVILLVAMFTVLDDIITPLYYSLNWAITKTYWAMSLTAVIPQEICAILTMIFIFPILVKTFTKLSYRKGVKTLNEYRLV